MEIRFPLLSGYYPYSMNLYQNTPQRPGQHSSLSRLSWECRLPPGAGAPADVSRGPPSLSAVSARGLGVLGLPLHPRRQEDRDIDTVRIFARDPPSRRQAHDIKGPRHFSPLVDFSFVLLSSYFISQNI